MKAGVLRGSVLVLSLLCVLPVTLLPGTLLPGTLRAEDRPRKVLLIGQQRDHPPGAHQYMAGLRVLAKCLERMPDLEVSIMQADEPWPEGPNALGHVDCLVLSLGQGGRWIQNDPQRLAAIQQLADNDTGIVALHWAIGAQDGKYITPYREIIGGVHGGEDRKYIFTESELVPLAPQHPVLTGVPGITIKDEWYYQLKMSPRGQVEPLLAALIDGQRETVAWAYTRSGGGRSFGFSGMHYHENWKNDSLRRMIVQAVLWTLKLPIPEQGIPVDVPPAIYQLEPGE